MRIALSICISIILTFPVHISVAKTQRNTGITNPPKLEGLAYPKARRVIIGFGWKPVAGGCSGGGSGAVVCKHYPEISNCSGNGDSFCDMLFIKQRKCLTVITSGGSPDGDARVQDVLFRSGPCVKNPE